MAGGICFMILFLFFFLPDNGHCDIIAIFCLMHYSLLSVMKINVLAQHTEPRIIDASVAQWYSQLKTCICANCSHLSTWCKLICVDKQRNSIPREHLR